MFESVNLVFEHRGAQGIFYYPRGNRDFGEEAPLFVSVRQFEFDQATQLQSVIVDVRKRLTATSVEVGFADVQRRRQQRAGKRAGATGEPIGESDEDMLGSDGGSDEHRSSVDGRGLRGRGRDGGVVGAVAAQEGGAAAEAEAESKRLPFFGTGRGR